MRTVVYRGNFQPNVPEQARWSTESQVAATLEAMGHRVIRTQEVGGGGYEAATWADTETACRREGADLLLWTCTGNVDPEGGYRTLDRLRRAGIPTASFHLDLYWGLQRAVQLLDHPFFRTDYVLTADGGHQDGFARNGINHHWSPPAIFEREAVVGTAREEYRTWPIIFVGSYPYPHAEHAEARRDMVLMLQSRFGRYFRHYRGGIRGQALADLYASAPIIVGDSCLAGRSPRYWSDRIPETLGRSGFLIHPHVEGIEDHYTDGKHLRTFEPGDLGQLITLVAHYFQNRDEAAAIARAGREHVLAHHTYKHRMEAVLATVGLTPTQTEEPAHAV